jgi:hypothetical protein
MERKKGVSSKYTGLSKASIRHGFRRSERQSHLLLATKQAERRIANEAKRRATIQGKLANVRAKLELTVLSTI